MSKRFCRLVVGCLVWDGAVGVRFSPEANGADGEMVSHLFDVEVSRVRFLLRLNLARIVYGYYLRLLP